MRRATRWLGSNPEELALLALITLGLLIVPLLPDTLLTSTPSLCIFRMITGKPCWGCGMTRALWSILHGDIVSAIKYNWRGIIVAPVLGALYLRWATRCLNGRTK